MARWLIVPITVCVVASQPSTAAAQQQRSKVVAFAPGASEARYRDVIRGYQTVDYLVRARRGQRLTVHFSTNNPSAYFSIFAPNSQEPSFDGTMAVSTGSGNLILPRDGQARVRVYLYRNAARSGERARYDLTVEVRDGGVASQLPGDVGAQLPENGEADDGGPDWWQVDFLEPNDLLNIRAQPSANAPVLTRLTMGRVVRNLGCRTAAGGRWCRVQLPGAQGITGYASGRYLREGIAPR